jgi:hypothetical protein
MDESIVKHLETPELTGESLKYHLLAEAIRRGKKTVIESHSVYLVHRCGCAIAMAAVGFGYDSNATAMSDVLFPYVERHSGIRYKELRMVDCMHYTGTTALAIADRLDDVAYRRIAEF